MPQISALALVAMGIAVAVHLLGFSDIAHVLEVYLFVASASLLGLWQFNFRGAAPGAFEFL